MKEYKKHGHPKFYKILEELSILHSNKNHDYAVAEEPLSNLNRSMRVGVPTWIGCLIRMQDKFDRIENFAKQRNLAVTDETVVDTLNDLAVYSILCRILYEEAKMKDNVKKSIVEIDPVHYIDGAGWFFWDETWSVEIGPYTSECEAGIGWKHYCRDNNLDVNNG